MTAFGFYYNMVFWDSNSRSIGSGAILAISSRPGYFDILTCKWSLGMDSFWDCLQR